MPPTRYPRAPAGLSARSAVTGTPAIPAAVFRRPDRPAARFPGTPLGIVGP